MFLEEYFSGKELDAFVKTLEITCSIAASIMGIRYFNFCSSSFSRKLLHICTQYCIGIICIGMAPAYIMCWVFFPNTVNAKYLALSSNWILNVDSQINMIID